MQPEQKIKNDILRYLQAIGVFCFSVRNGATYDPVRKIYRANTTMKGISDIIGVLPGDGRIIALEVKTERGRLSPDQKIFLEVIHSHGGISGVVRSIDDAREILEKHMSIK